MSAKLQVVTPDFKAPKPKRPSREKVEAYLREQIEQLKSRVSDLEDDVENERRRGDEEYDRAESLQREIDEEYTSNDVVAEDYIELTSEGGEALDVVALLSESFMRLELGVTSELDNIRNYIEQLKDYKP